jgi:hypothetical protein
VENDEMNGPIVVHSDRWLAKIRAQMELSAHEINVMGVNYGFEPWNQIKALSQEFNYEMFLEEETPGKPSRLTLKPLKISN